jgi:hypothetical protein
MSHEHLKDVLIAVGPRFMKLPSATPSDLLELERVLGISLPTEHRDFLLWSNGGELDANGQAIDFWNADKVAARNQRLQVSQRLPNLLLIGSNEGEIALGFEGTAGATHFIAIPFGGLSPETIKIISSSGGEAVRQVLLGELDLDEVCYR